MNKRTFILITGIFAISLTLLAVFFTLTSKESPAIIKGPEISISQDLIELGEIPINQKSTSVVEIKNEGDGALEINKITTSCSCTTATFIDTDGSELITFFPGESHQLEIVFDPQFHDDQPLGKVTREVYIKSNDPENSEITIRLQGVII